MKQGYLICYDIKDEKRLTKVYKYLSGIAIHIQYSVFYYGFDYYDLIQLKENLRRLINEKEDDVRIYPLSSNPKVLVMGQGKKLPEALEVYLK